MNIPDEAVDAAADPIYDYIENLGGTDLEMARNIAYAALRRAAPLIAAQALRGVAADFRYIGGPHYEADEIAGILNGRADTLEGK